MISDGIAEIDNWRLQIAHVHDPSSLCSVPQMSFPTPDGFADLARPLSDFANSNATRYRSADGGRVTVCFRRNWRLHREQSESKEKRPSPRERGTEQKVDGTRGATRTARSVRVCKAENGDANEESTDLRTQAKCITARFSPLSRIVGARV